MPPPPDNLLAPLLTDLQKQLMEFNGLIIGLTKDFQHLEKDMDETKDDLRRLSDDFNTVKVNIKGDSKILSVLYGLFVAILGSAATLIVKRIMEGG